MPVAGILLARSTPACNYRGPHVHEGTITSKGQNQIWGTDATLVTTHPRGMATVFVVADWLVGDLVGIPASHPGACFEALSPICQGSREHCGQLAKSIAGGLVLQYHHGPQSISPHIQEEAASPGINSRPSFAGTPKGNSVAERYVKTTKRAVAPGATFQFIKGIRLALLGSRGGSTGSSCSGNMTTWPN